MPTHLTTDTTIDDLLPSQTGNSGKFLKTNGTVASWDTASGSGDTSTNTSSSVDSEVVLFSGTGGKTLKRASGTGVAHLTSGVLSASNVTESEITLADNTTNDVSTSKHGFLPKLPTATGKYLKDDLTWGTPATSTAWGGITGTLSSQTDLQTALDNRLKIDASNGPLTKQTIIPDVNYLHLKQSLNMYGMGDSITYLGIANLSPFLNNLTGTTWTVNNKGVNGETTTQMEARFNTDVITPGNAKVVTILGGVNDAALDVAVATTESKLQSMYTAAHNEGIIVVALTITPWKGSSLWSSARQTAIETINNWIKNTATNIDYIIDTYELLEDPNTAQTLLAAYDSGDHIHLSTAGKDVMWEYVYKNVVWPGYTLEITNDTTLSGTNTGDQTLPTDATIVTTDVTTNNASTSKHGWFPKLPTPTGLYLKDDLSWGTPTSSIPDTLQTKNSIGANTTLTGGYSSYVPQFLEVGDTYTYEVGLQSYLEIG